MVGLEPTTLTTAGRSPLKHQLSGLLSLYSNNSYSAVARLHFNSPTLPGTHPPKREAPTRGLPLTAFGSRATKWRKGWTSHFPLPKLWSPIYQRPIRLRLRRQTSNSFLRSFSTSARARKVFQGLARRQGGQSEQPLKGLLGAGGRL